MIMTSTAEAVQNTSLAVSIVAQRQCVSAPFAAMAIFSGQRQGAFGKSLLLVIAASGFCSLMTTATSIIVKSTTSEQQV